MACDDRAPGSGVSQERVGEETRRETIRGVRFSSVILPVVTGVDDGVSRRPWDLRQRHLLLEYWWLEAVEKGVSRVGEEKKGSVSPVSGGRRRRQRPWPAEWVRRW